MQNIQVIIIHGGKYSENGKYVEYSVSGMLLPYGSSYKDLCELIKTTMKIPDETNVRLAISYEMQEDCHAFKVENDFDVAFYIDIKKTDGTAMKYPLTVNIVDDHNDQQLQQLHDLTIQQYGQLEEAIPMSMISDITNKINNVLNEIEMGYLQDMVEQTTQMALEFKEDDKAFMNTIDDSESDEEVNPAKVKEIKVGDVYDNKKNVQIAICHYALWNHFNFKVTKSCRKNYFLSCVDDNCKRAFKSSLMCRTSTFKVRMFNDVHTCSLEDRFKENRNATSFFIANVMKKRYRETSSYYGPINIQEDIKSNCGVEIDYSKAWRAREIIIADVLGKTSVSYQNVPTYLHMLEQTNPGTVARIKTSNDGSFLYAFIALSASIEGFKFCRPQVVVDGAFLSTSYGGTLLTVCKYNSAGGILPLAFAIVDSENNETYHWFFDCFRDAYGYNEKMCFISDRAESIAYGVKQVYPEVGHYYYIYHLENNIKPKCRISHRDLHKWFFKVAKAYTQQDFDNCMMELLKLSKTVVDYITIDVPMKKWAALYSKHYRRQAMTSNIAESLNSKNKKIRDLPITAMLEQLRSHIQQWSIKFRRQSTYTVTPLTDKYHKIIFRRMIKLKEFTVVPSSHYIYKVTGNWNNFVVDLERKTCSCREFQEDELPCQHAVQIIMRNNLDIVKFYSPFYLNDTLKATYALIVHPIPTCAEINIPDDVRSIVVNTPARKAKVG